MQEHAAEGLPGISHLLEQSSWGKKCVPLLEGLYTAAAGSRKAGNCFMHLDSWES